LFRRLARAVVRQKIDLGRQSPGTDNGFQPAGRPAPIRPRLPQLSAAAEAPLPAVDEGPGIVYALGRVR